jgi:HAD superfamily hydrolase (TIGR01549 family)
MKTPQAILFDFGGTLDSDGVPWKDRFRSMAGVSGPSESFDRAYYTADDALVGTIPRDLSFRETIDRLSRNLVRALGWEEQRAEPLADAFFQTSRSKAEASREILGQLARRFRLGIVSNFYGNLERVCDDFGISKHVGVLVDSAVVGFEKPDPRIFRAALDALEVSPEHAVFVGDSLPRDMEGARGLGMAHIYVSPADDAISCCPADPVIPGVSRLLEMYP